MFKSLLKGLSSLLGETVLDEVQERVDTTIDEVKLAVEQAAENVVRQLILLAFVILGLVFGLVGIAKLLNDALPQLGQGAGYLLLGLVLLLVALIARHSGRERKR
ncbi:hypothetical protein KY327_00785 [Candidatus Woesearchaeota archaeon]|nr:hypothetical protein [Candidatus Woesearchaeota archaeon]